jgi:hypothetical protein
VRARLSRPLQRGRGKHVGRGDYRPGRGPAIMSRPSWSRPAPRSFSSRGARGIGSRALPPVRPISARDRRPVMSVPVRSRPLPPPARSYDRRPAGMSYEYPIYFLIFSFIYHFFIINIYNLVVF